MAGVCSTTDEETRWVVVGLCLNKVLTPALRSVLETEITKWHEDLCKSRIEIDKQVKKLLGLSTSYLNYKNINNNESNGAYDYRVKDPLSLAKLFVQPFMCKFDDFDKMDLSAILSVIVNATRFTAAADCAKTFRSDVRNEWAHCNFACWTEDKFLSSIESMKTLLKEVNLSSEEEQKLCDKLDHWKTEGLQLHFGECDTEVLKLFKDEVGELYEFVQKWMLENEEMKTTLLSAVKAVQDNLNEDLLRKMERLDERGNSNSLRIAKCEEQGTRHSKEIERLRKEFTSELSSYSNKEDVKVPYVFSAPPKNDHFAGRKKEIEELKRILKVEERRNEKKVGVAAVWGLGGVGKTSLVSEYAHQMKDLYKGGVYWFSAENDSFLEKTVKSMASNIGASHGSFDVALPGILKKISRVDDPCLIVLDCLDQESLSLNMKTFLLFPSQENISGHFIMVTRRNPTQLVNDIAILKEDSFFQLKCFQPQEAKQFLFLRTSVTCDETVESVAESLCQELGGLPLALEQAGAYIKILGCSLSSYLEQYKDERLKLLSEQRARSASPGNESSERLAVHTTWCINMEHIKKSPDGPAAVTFMNACSFFNASEIEKELINVGTPEVEDKAFRQCVLSPLGCYQILKSLTDFSLFTFVNAKSVSTHRLVQELIMENLDGESKYKSLVDAVRMLSCAFSKCPLPSRLIEPSRSHSDLAERPSLYYFWSKLCMHGRYLCGIMENLLETPDFAFLKPVWCLETVKILYECALHFSANHKPEKGKRTLNFAYRVLDWCPVAEYEKIKTSISDNSLFPLDIPLPKPFQIEIIESCMPSFSFLQPLTHTPSHEAGDFDLKQEVEGLRLDGNNSYKAGRYREALDMYSSALNLAKDCSKDCSKAFNPLLLTNRSMAYIKLKRYEDALKDANNYITLRPDCWRGYARKALALDGLNEKVSAEIAASLAFYHSRGIFSRFQPFKECFRGLLERTFVCDSVDKLQKAIFSPDKKTGELTQLRILVLGSKEYILDFRTDIKPLSNCILVGTRPRCSVTLKLNFTLPLRNMCMLTNLSFCFTEGQVHCLPGSLVKILNCNFTSDDDKKAAVSTEGISNVKKCIFRDSKAGGLLCVGPGNMKVVDCSFCNNGKAGLQVRKGGTLTVENSRMFNNGLDGLLIGPEAAKCIAINCNIYQNDREGITMLGSKNITIEKNSVSSNDHGIYMTNSEADIRESKVFDNEIWGIWSQSNSRCNISMNEVYRNKVGGVRVGYRAAGERFSPSVVERNQIHDNIGPGYAENVNMFEVRESPHANEDLMETYMTSKRSLQPARCKDNKVYNNKDSKNIVKLNLSVPYCSNCSAKCEQKRCNICFTAAYCDKTCEKNHWSKHNQLCKVLLEKSSFVITSWEQVSCQDKIEQVEVEKEIGGTSSPPPRDGSRFVVKVHHAIKRQEKETYSLVVYDRSRELYCKFDSKYIYQLVKEFGVICERTCYEKKLFFHCWFEKDGQPRLFTNEFAEFQDW